MIEFRFEKKDQAALKEKLRKISPKERDGVSRLFFRDLVVETNRELKTNVSGSLLKVRSGRLRDSIGFSIEEDKDGLLGVVGSGVGSGRERVKYANIQETGGTIRAKGKMLTIPTNFARTPAGDTRFTAQEVRQGRTPYVASYVHNNVIYGVTNYAKGSLSTPLFILRTSVTIKPKRYMAITNQTIQEKWSAIADRTIGKYLEAN